MSRLQKNEFARHCLSATAKRHGFFSRYFPIAAGPSVIQRWGVMARYIDEWNWPQKGALRVCQHLCLFDALLQLVRKEKGTEVNKNGLVNSDLCK